MINLDKTKPVWLIADTAIGSHFAQSVGAVWEEYRKAYDVTAKGSSASKLRIAFSNLGTVFYGRWDKNKVEKLLTACFWKYEVNLAEIDQSFKKVGNEKVHALLNFYRVVFIHLWTKKVLLVPLNLTAPIHADEVVDAVCLNSGLKTLFAVRSVNTNSGIRYAGKIDFESRNRRATFWLRLLMSTTFYSPDDLNSDDCKNLIRNGFGEGDLPLRRYYVTDLLITIAEGCADKIKMVESATAILAEEKVKVVKKSRKARSIRAEKRREEAGEKIASELHSAADKAIDYVSGRTDSSVDYLVEHVLTARRIKKTFNFEGDSSKVYLYSKLPEKVRLFCNLVNGVFRGLIKSKRLQRDSQAIHTLNLMLSYVSIYLTRFYIERDSCLDDYPETLNDFHCAVFITRESVFLDGSIEFEKQPPMTFLAYLNKIGRINGWVNETLYAKILLIESFFDHVIANRALIPNTDKVKNTFTPACYPKLQKKTGTVKNPLPREYFGTFVDMLYSLEYLIAHLNEMAAGRMPGVVGGKLYQPTDFEMREHFVWRGLWGTPNQPGSKLNLNLLNYTPIFYHERRIYRFEYLPFFFRTTKYEIDGVVAYRANPNDVRVTILMCETGIRQHHIVWLDKDKYDCVLDRSSKSQLAPLFVSSDKSHGEWTAVVARRIFGVLDRQRGWYNSCSLEEYKEDLWYGLKEGSKFGKYKPLFRVPSSSEKSHESWKNHRIFPMLLFVLQYFIRQQLRDNDCEDLVSVKYGQGEEELISNYSHVALEEINIKVLQSKHTPHGLRAGFVSEAIRFLPPSIIGQYLTGQTEELVWYYSVFDPEDMPDHQQLLANYLTRNMDKLSKGEAPHLADAILKVNSRLMEDIQKDATKAIEMHGLMSLSGIKDDQTGIDVLRARRYTKLAFNACHICPFGNVCPKEVVEMLGVGRPCALCPYAIRGVDHLPAVSAEKDKCKEVMVGVLKKIAEYKTRDQKSRSQQELENLNFEHDKYAREAYALEAIEQQLYMMVESGQHACFFLRNKDGLVNHLGKFGLTEGQHMIKRLIDVQNFPDATSPELDVKFAYMRAVLLVNEGKVDELLKVEDKTPANLLASQIRSMVNAGQLDVMDMFKIGQVRANLPHAEKPVAVIAKQIGLEDLA